MFNLWVWNSTNNFKVCLFLRLSSLYTYCRYTALWCQKMNASVKLRGDPLRSFYILTRMRKLFPWTVPTNTHPSKREILLKISIRLCTSSRSTCSALSLTDAHTTELKNGRWKALYAKKNTS